MCYTMKMNSHITQYSFINVVEVEPQHSYVIAYFIVWDEIIYPLKFRNG